MSQVTRYLTFWAMATALMFAVVVASLAVYVDMEMHADHAQRQRYDSLLLANELWHSSESLTKMARSYLVTGDPRFKKLFHEILDIRDGRKPWTRNSLYAWDLAVYGDKLQQDQNVQAVPLLELVQKAAFDENETRLLEIAKKNSDELARTELEAMRLFDSAGPSAPEIRQKALDMLLSPAYNQAKLAILQPISQFNSSMDARTAAAVKHSLDMAFLFRLIFVVVGLIWLYMLWRSYQSLRSLLGASPAVVHEQISRLGRGDFTHPPQQVNADDNTVIAWICQTRRKLNEMSQAQARVEQQIRKRSEELERSEAHLKSIIDLSPVPKMLFDSRGKITGMNAAFTRCFGYTPEDLPTLDAWQSRAYPDPAYRKWVMETCQKHHAASMRNDDPFQPIEFRIVSKDGSIRTAITEAVSIAHKTDGNITLAVFHDITDLRNTELQLREAKERLEAAASAGIVGIWDWDVVNNRLVWDKVMYQLYGTREEDFGGAYEAWSSALHPEDREFAEREIQAALKGEREYTPEFRVIWPDGSVHYLKAMSHTTFDPDGKPLRIVGVNYDLTEQKHIQQELDKMAFYDRLTNLPNRRLFEDRLHQAIALAQREQRKVSLLFIDLDKFKQVNDEKGHEAGDWLLQQVAKRIVQCLRVSDTAARLGGDEFVALLPDIKVLQDATSIAEKIRLCLEKPFEWKEGQLLEISSSIGVSVYPDHADNPQELLRFGDEAMYHAKKGGRNAVHVFKAANGGCSEFCVNG